jgi:hypothetical protein
VPAPNVIPTGELLGGPVSAVNAALITGLRHGDIAAAEREVAIVVRDNDNRAARAATWKPVT